MRGAGGRRGDVHLDGRGGRDEVDGQGQLGRRRLSDRRRHGQVHRGREEHHRELRNRPGRDGRRRGERQGRLSQGRRLGCRRHQEDGKRQVSSLQPGEHLCRHDGVRGRRALVLHAREHRRGELVRRAGGGERADQALLRHVVHGDPVQRRRGLFDGPSVLSERLLPRLDAARREGRPARRADGKVLHLARRDHVQRARTHPEHVHGQVRPHRQRRREHALPHERISARFVHDP